MGSGLWHVCRECWSLSELLMYVNVFASLGSGQQRKFVFPSRNPSKQGNVLLKPKIICSHYHARSPLIWMNIILRDGEANVFSPLEHNEWWDFHFLCNIMIILLLLSIKLVVVILFSTIILSMCQLICE